MSKTECLMHVNMRERECVHAGTQLSLLVVSAASPSRSVWPWLRPHHLVCHTQQYTAHSALWCTTQHNTSHSTKYNILRTQTTKHTHLPQNTQQTGEHTSSTTQHNHSSEQNRQHSTVRLPPGSKSPNYSDSNTSKKEPVNCHLWRHSQRTWH